MFYGVGRLIFGAMHSLQRPCKRWSVGTAVTILCNFFFSKNRLWKTYVIPFPKNSFTFGRLT